MGKSWATNLKDVLKIMVKRRHQNITCRSEGTLVEVGHLETCSKSLMSVTCRDRISKTDRYAERAPHRSLRTLRSARAQPTRLTANGPLLTLGARPARREARGERRALSSERLITTTDQDARWIQTVGADLDRLAVG